MSGMLSRQLQRLVRRGGLRWLVVVLAAVSSVQYVSTGLPTLGGHGAAETSLQRAFHQQVSGVWVETEGVVVKRLRDDRQGSRHQRFIVRAPSGQSLLVSHNIDLAAKVPLTEGDHIKLRGRYEWNEQGGLIHWTHHDPQGRKPGGWIEQAGRTYR